jgi:diguanylate cyclase (GGDEF)-like protein
MSRRQGAPFWAQADRDRRLAELALEPDPNRLLARLAEFGRGDLAAHAALLNWATTLDLAEPEAETLLRAILEGRARAASALGRDPGLVWAALDYGCNVRALVGSPAVVDASRSGAATAGMDARTGVLDRSAVEREISRELRRTLRHGRTAAILVGALDPPGDHSSREGSAGRSATLDRSLRSLRRALRESDVPGHSGDDEFVALLPRTDRLAATAVAERLRLRIAEDAGEQAVHARVVRRTLSIGIACVPEDAAGVEGWLHAARSALAQARDQGGDRVVAHARERRSAVRMRTRSALAATLLARDGTTSPVRIVELARDGIVIDGLRECAAHGLVRVRIETPRAWVAEGRVVRCVAGTGRTAIALAERLPPSILGDMLDGRRRPVIES